MTTIPDDIGSGERFALLVKGDSMIDVGIMDGDRVIMKQQETAENGEIVCALINDAEARKMAWLRSKRKTKSTPRSSSRKANSGSSGGSSGCSENFRMVPIVSAVPNVPVV